MSTSLLNQPGPSAALSPAAPVPLPAIALPRLDSQACKVGEKGWRNIPEAVRDALAQLTETVSALHTANSTLVLAVNRRAGHSECMQALAGRASQEQLQAVTRYLQRDLLPRLEQPCTAHAASARVVSGLQGRVTQLEAVVQAQDAALRQVQRELAVARTECSQALTTAHSAAAAAAQQREQEEESDMQFVTRAELQSMLAHMGCTPTPTPAASHEGAATSATGSAGVSAQPPAAALHSKADAAVVQALSNDVEMLAEGLSELKLQVQSALQARHGPLAAAAALAQEAGTGAEGDNAVDGATRLFNAEKKLPVLLGAQHALEAALDARLPARDAPRLQALLHTVEGGGGMGEVVGRVERLDESLRIVQARVTQLSVAQATASIADVSHGGATGAGGAGVPAKTALQSAVEQALRPKIAVLSTSMQQQAAASKEALAREVEARVSSAKEEWAKDLRSKMNALRLEVGKQIHGKASVSPEQVQQLLGAEAESLHRQMTARLSGAMSELRGEISAVRTLAMETALQAQGAGVGGGGSLPGLGATTGHAGSLPLAELSGRVDALQQTVSMSEARVLARLESVQASERRLGESLHAQVEAAVAALHSQMAALEAQHQDAAQVQSKAASVNAALVSLQSQVQGLVEKQQLALHSPPPAPLPVQGQAGAPSITGRWVWKNRRLTSWSDEAQVSGRCVIWDVQSLNSSSDLLLWSPPQSLASHSKSKGEAVQEGTEVAATVTAVKSGLYRVSLGFFALILPSLTLCVDGQPVLSTGPPQDTMVPGPGLLGAQPAEGEGEEQEGSVGQGAQAVSARQGRVRFAGAGSSRRAGVGGERGVQEGAAGEDGSQDSSLDTTALLEGAASSPALLSGVQVGGAGPVLHKHPAGCVAGVTCTHYLALPAKAKLTVRYAGKAKGQGFLELTKL